MEDEIDLEQMKKSLVEEYGLFMEKERQFAPIAARIFTTLLINRRHEATFDELIKFIGASKSTISTNLKILQKDGVVSYYTKSGDRKKYFTLNPEGMLSRIDNSIKVYQKEQKHLIQFREFKQLANRVHSEEVYSIVSDMPYLDFLTNTLSSLKLLHKKIEEKFSLKEAFKK